MKVFLSWSGETSKQVATALWRWLPYMIQSIKPFISSNDISKGDTWNDVLATELHGAKYGVICVTPYNVNKPWMIFEAGAMAHFVGRSRVTPCLFRVEPKALEKSPLAQFQSTVFAKDDFYRLIFSINSALPQDDQVNHELLEQNFKHWWCKLNDDLKEIPEASPSETRTCYEWLKTSEDLNIHDVSCGCSVIWIVTGNAYQYVIAPKKQIEANLKDAPGKMQYRFLFPNKQDVLQFRKELDDLHLLYNEGFAYRLIGDSFAQLAPSDYVIKESFGQKAPAPAVFVRAPIGDSGTEYWLAVEEKAAYAFSRRFKDLWSETPAPTANNTTGS